MYSFAYHRATSLEAAVEALDADSEAVLIAGGQTLVPTLKQRLAAPTALIDISKLASLHGITFDGTNLKVGAMTRHFEVAESDLVRERIPGLAELAGNIGDPLVRHRGTIGGSVANNDPAADYPAACLALDAVIETDRRTVHAADFFVGLFETALAPGEIVTSIVFPIPKLMAYAKFRNPASRYAMVGACVALGDGGPRVAITGSGKNGVFRWAAAEARLDDHFAPSALIGISISPDELNSDIHGGADYRAALVVEMIRRAVASAGSRIAHD